MDKALVLMFLLGACVFALGIIVGVYFGPRRPYEPAITKKHLKRVGFKL